MSEHDKPVLHLNEFQQPVREYTWEDFQARIKKRKNYTGEEDLNGKTLVVRHTWGLGDVLYMTSALKAIKEKFPYMRLVCITSFPDILEGNPVVDMNFHWMQFQDFLDLGDNLKQEGDWYFVSYDTPLKGGFDYKFHLRTKPQLNEHLYDLIKKDPKDLKGDELEFVNSAANTLINRYKMIALDMYCYHLHVDPPVKSVYYYPKDHELKFAQMFLKPLRKDGRKIITLMPHTSTFFKDYPHWRTVISLCPEYNWLILDKSSRDGERWIGSNIYNCIGAFNLRQLAALIIEGDMCCSSDTGLLYTKAARGGKCIVTYGPHEPQPFLHYFPSAHGLRIDRLVSTPGMEGKCSIGCYIDTTSCRNTVGAHPPCLDELDPRRVANEIQSHMESGNL